MKPLSYGSESSHSEWIYIVDVQRRGFNLIDQKMSKLRGSELDEFGIPRKISHMSVGNRMKLKVIHLKELFATRRIVPHCSLVKSENNQNNSNSKQFYGLKQSELFMLWIWNILQHKCICECSFILYIVVRPSTIRRSLADREMNLSHHRWIKERTAPARSHWEPGRRYSKTCLYL